MVAIGRRDFLEVSLFDEDANDPGVKIDVRWAPSQQAWETSLTQCAEVTHCPNNRFTRQSEPLPTSFDLQIPPQESNLVYRALAAFREAFGIRQSLHAKLVKRIPAGAGMGGASSDAASTLLCAATLLDIPYQDDRIHSIAARLGSDVPFFLGAKPDTALHSRVADKPKVVMAALGRGRGEKLTPIECDGSLRFVVVYPPGSISTAKAYGLSRIPAQSAEAMSVIQALQTGKSTQLGHILKNRLTESAVQISPWIERTLKSIRRAGLQSVTMTGSGSACFGIARNASHARRVANRLAAQRVGVCFTAAPTCLPAPVFYVA